MNPQFARAHLARSIVTGINIDDHAWTITCECGEQFTSDLTLTGVIDAYGHHLIGVAMWWATQPSTPETDDRNSDPDPGPIHVPRLGHRILRWFGFSDPPTKTTR